MGKLRENLLRSPPRKNNPKSKSKKRKIFVFLRGIFFELIVVVLFVGLLRREPAEDVFPCGLTPFFSGNILVFTFK